MPQRTQSYLNARASIGRDLWLEGKISLEERLRLSSDARAGRDTGPVVYLPEKEWRRARLMARIFMEQKKKSTGSNP